MGCNCGGTPLVSAPIAGATTATTTTTAPAPPTVYRVTFNDGSDPLTYTSEVEAYAAAGATGGTVEERAAGA